jgi:adenosylmethionine-8-amino-7-oxononanoate aminotransferase
MLTDADGREYIDGVASLWCNVHGHHVKELDAAITNQLSQVAHSTLLGLSNVPAVKLARRLVELAPPGLEHVFFSDDGSTAVEVALKMAFQYWRQRPDPQPRKTKFLSLTDAYHGDTIGSTSVGAIERFHHIFGPLLFPTINAPSPYCYRCPLGLERKTCQIDCLAELARLIEQHHDELAAVVIEPLVQGAAGMIVAPDGYLRRVRELTKQHDVLLIADEVAVGFGRTGTMFACEQEDVSPDLLCLSKGLTGGYLPMAATLTTGEIYSAFLDRPEAGKTFYHGHTYTGNPLAAAVALASIELFDKNDLLASLPAKIESLRRHFERMASLPWVGDIRQKGMIAGVELVADKLSKKPFAPSRQIGRQVCLRARSHGVLLRPLGDVIVVFPPLSIEPPQLDRLCDAVYASIQEVCGDQP